MDGLIPAEKLAAFIDGRLDPEERREVLAALARSDADREALADAIAITGDETVPVELAAAARSQAGRATRRWRWLVPMAAAAAVVLITVLQGPGRDADAALRGAVAAAPAALGAGWSDVGWAVVRGEEAAGERALFRAGVRLVDLEIAARAGDAAAVRALALETAGLLRSLPAGAPLAERVEAVARSPAPSASEVEAASAGIAEAMASPALRLGRQLETARIASMIGRADIARDQLSRVDSEPTDVGLRTISMLTGRLDALRSSDPAGLQAGLAALIRELGS